MPKIKIIAGDEDLIFLAPTIKALADAIPNSHYYCFKSCGHLPHLEYPDTFIDVVQRHLQSQQPHL